MKFTLATFILLTVSGWTLKEVSRVEFYPVFRSESVADMQNMIKTLESQKKQAAYLGALKMKYSGFIKGVNEKLETFKSGRDLLEKEISNNSANIEWRFLRMVIQENAPKILRYNSELEIDKTFIETNYSSASLDLQKIIKAYADNSKTLNPAVLN